MPTLPRPKKQPDVISYHTREEIPNYWAYAKHYVLQDRMFAPADSGRSRHTCSCSRMGGVLPGHERPDELPLEHRPVGRHQQSGTPHPPIYAWTDITYLLRQGVSAGRTTWAMGTCVHEPCTRAGPVRRDAGEEPAPGVRRRGADTQLDHPAPTRVRPRREAGTLPSVSWIMPGHRASEHPGSGADPNGQAYVTRLVNAAMHGPTGIHGHLPHLGRLGRLLRPRHAPEGRPERVRPAGARAS